MGDTEKREQIKLRPVVSFILDNFVIVNYKA